MRFRSSSKNQGLSFAVSILFVILIAGISMFGQATGGAVTGTVIDAAGAVVPNATVTILNKETGLKLTTQSSNAGGYSFPNVQVGNYTLSAEAATFATGLPRASLTVP